VPWDAELDNLAKYASEHFSVEELRIANGRAVSHAAKTAESGLIDADTYFESLRAELRQLVRRN